MKIQWLAGFSRVVLCFVFILGSGCSGLVIRTGDQDIAEKLPNELPESVSSMPEPSDKELEDQIKAANAELAEDDETGDKIPIEVNHKVKKWIRFFTTSHRDVFQRFIDRGSNFEDLIREALKENSMPQDLFYVAMIESGFVVQAKSHASAVGIWQFMRRTSQHYGLTVNGYVDERQDPVRATHAASRYFTDLHNIFRSWYLAIAAYNAGEYRIINAIKKTKTRNFWELVNMKALPKETMNYVPKFLAAVIINRNPEKFGFRRGSREHPFPKYEFVSIPSYVNLGDLSRVSGISLATLQKMNPHLRLLVTPPGKTYQIAVPKDQAFVLKRGDIQKELLAAQRIPQRRPASRASGYYVVKCGDTLIKIANQHRMTLTQLKRQNNLKSGKILVGKRLRVSGAVNYKKKSAYYVVQRGDTLTKIANQHGISLAQLIKQNNLKSGKILVGKRLRVSATVSKATRGKTAKLKHRVHRVRPGETLLGIARKYGLSLDQLRSSNRIRGDRLLSGQKLIVAER